jgi:hypothetical protein
LKSRLHPCRWKEAGKVSQSLAFLTVDVADRTACQRCPSVIISTSTMPDPLAKLDALLDESVELGFDIGSSLRAPATRLGHASCAGRLSRTNKGVPTAAT